MTGKLCGAKLGRFGEKDNRCRKYASKEGELKGRCTDTHRRCRYQLDNGKGCARYQVDGEDRCDQHKKIDETKPKVNNKGQETLDVNHLAKLMDNVEIEHDVERHHRDGSVTKVGKRILINCKKVSANARQA